MRLILLTCLATALALISFRSIQSFTVHGKITDDQSNALTGVSVTEKGTSNSVITDSKGEFVITVQNEKSKLVISSVGFEKKEVSIKGQAKLNISLGSLNAKLDEVVVIGYSTRDAEVYYENDSRAAPAKIKKSTVATPLQGSVPGISVTQNGRRKEGKRDRWQDNNQYNTEDYDKITENRFLTANENPLSTFSIDVDAASYSNVRRYLQTGQLPPAGSVRIEEMINYFHYEYPQPVSSDPFSINTEMADCPWNNKHKLVLIGLQGKKIPVDNLPASNLVFLIDVSGSMDVENKLPLVRSSMKLLVDNLREQDRVSIVVYAGSAGLVLPPTSGADKTTIKDAIDKLQAGGSTAGGEGIKLAYKTAKQNFVREGNNRVILCTDGDFNVGVSSDAELETMIEKERKSGVFLTVLGYGMGNYKDNKMQKLADKGNGNHAYIDGMSEAKKVLVSEFGGTLFTIAKDVKLQIEFNPAKVQAYRLIGYENRMLNKEDFNNDQKDAGELGSGHTVTALYEVIPVGVKNEFEEKVDKLKYQKQAETQKYSPVASNEIMNVKFRYKQPDGDVSKLIVHPLIDQTKSLSATSNNFRFAAAVAQFGMMLTDSEFKQQSSFDKAWQLASNAVGNDEEGYRSEFLKLLKSAQTLAKKQTKKNKEEEEEEEEVGVR